MSLISMLQQERKLIKGAIRNLSDEQFVAIPQGHKNNILWNYGHIIVTQQQLHYTLTGQQEHVSQDLISTFRNGTSPADWKQVPERKELDELLVELPEKLAADYQAGRLDNFRSYTTSTGVELKTIEDSLVFNHFHEGLHLGIIMQLLKRV